MFSELAGILIVHLERLEALKQCISIDCLVCRYSHGEQVYSNGNGVEADGKGKAPCSVFLADAIQFHHIPSCARVFTCASKQKGIKPMNEFNRAYTPKTGADSMDASVNEGLRTFMLGVYNKMALGLLLTAGLAYAFGALVPENVTLTLLTGPIGLVIMFAPLAILLLSSFVMKNPSPLAANLVYWSVVSLIGVGMGAIVYVYARQPDGMLIVSKAFLTTAIAFGGLSLYGYTTKRDLSGFGTFLIMGVIGIIVASILNMFIFQSSMMHMVISVVGLLLFAGLTAFDTQRLKNMYFQLVGDSRAMAVATTYGALSLYLDFVNMFQFLLAIMSGRE